MRSSGNPAQRASAPRNGYRNGGTGGAELILAVVVAAAEADDAPTGTPFLVLSFLEWQRADELEQFRFLLDADEVPHVAEAGRPVRWDTEQLRLDHPVSMPPLRRDASQ
jgi:hypothetical protein